MRLLIAALLVAISYAQTDKLRRALTVVEGDGDAGDGGCESKSTTYPAYYEAPSLDDKVPTFDADDSTIFIAGVDGSKCAEDCHNDDTCTGFSVYDTPGDKWCQTIHATLDTTTEHPTYDDTKTYTKQCIEVAGADGDEAGDEADGAEDASSTCYEAADLNTNDCGKNTDKGLTAEECETYAGDLIGGNWLGEESVSDYPSGCYQIRVEHGANSGDIEVFWNDVDEGIPVEYAVPICKTTCADDSDDTAANSASSHGDPIIHTFKGECYDLNKDGLYLASSNPKYDHNVYVGVYNEFIREIQITDAQNNLLLSISNLNELYGDWDFGLKYRKRMCHKFTWKECEFDHPQHEFDVQIFKYSVQVLFHDYLDPALKHGERGVHLDIYPEVYQKQMKTFAPEEYQGIYFSNPHPEELPYCPNESRRWE